MTVQKCKGCQKVIRDGRTTDGDSIHILIAGHYFHCPVRGFRTPFYPTLVSHMQFHRQHYPAVKARRLEKQLLFYRKDLESQIWYRLTPPNDGRKYYTLALYNQQPIPEDQVESASEDTERWPVQPQLGATVPTGLAISTRDTPHEKGRFWVSISN